MSWLALAAAAALQLLAGVVRVRAWFHVIRHSWPGPTDLRYRDVVAAHLGGVGWNAILPAHSGDAVKVVLVSRQMPERRLALLASTLVPPGAVEAVVTGVLLAGLLATGLVSLDALVPPLPRGAAALAAGGAVCLAVAGAWIFRRRLRKVLSNVRAGLRVLGQPRFLTRCVLPWLLAGRGLRLAAYAFVLTAAGLPFGIGPAVALMALQGATPSAGAAATSARIALLAAVLSETGGSDVSAADVATALAAAYGVTSVANLVASVLAVAWLLRTTSPRHILAYVREAFGHVSRARRERHGRQPSPAAPSGRPEVREDAPVVVGRFADPEPTRARGR